VSEAELRGAREELFRAFLELLELSWADRGSITEGAVMIAADDLDDAVHQLIEAIAEDRRPHELPDA